MARPRTLDYGQIMRTFAETGNARETSLRLGIHFNTVYRVLRETRGECTRCNTPVAPEANMCSDCLKQTAAYEANKRERRLLQGTCSQCGEPAEPSLTKPQSLGRYCTKHRAEAACRAKERRARRMITEPEKVLAEGRRWNRNTLYGPAANTIWDRTDAQCAICDAPYVRRRSHIHHIDRNHANRSEENLIVLCASCHHLVHSLGAHRDPRLVLDWYERIYGEIRSLDEVLA